MTYNPSSGIFHVSGLYTDMTSLSGVGGTLNLDMKVSDHFYITLSASTTLTLSNISSKIGCSGVIVLKQNGTGGYTFTKATEMKTPLGLTISQVTTLNSVSALFYFVADATTVFINYVGDFK